MPDQGKPVQLAIVGVGIGAAAGSVEALGLFGLQVKPHVPRWQTLQKKEAIA